MTFDPLERFEAFCKNVTITSKEGGVIPLTWWGTQRYYINEIRRGLADGIHEFAHLKGRQEGITTIGVTLDVYWLNLFPGTQGEMVFDTDENRVYFRDVIGEVIESIPRNLRRPVKASNRAGLVFAGPKSNPAAVSRLLFQVCGKQAGATLGTGRGLNYFHGTEVGGWSGSDVQSAIDNLRAALAETYRWRLYNYEGTPRGYNHWHDLWQDFARSRFRRAVFIGWWRHEGRQFPKGTLQYAAYGEPHLSEEERYWTGRVKADYGVEITREQLAWWRYTSSEVIKSEAALYEAHPPIPELAWQATGSQFISPLTMARLEARVRLPGNEPVAFYAYSFGKDFEDTEVHEVAPEMASLVLWEQPKPGAVYVLGADPAYGSSGNADRFCASIWRQIGGGMIQVGEYLTPRGTMHQFAWVLAHLCGAFGKDAAAPTVLVLEVNGPGGGVIQELQRMVGYGWGMRAHQSDFRDVLANIRHYLYRRPDSLGGTTNTLHFKSTGDHKERLMNDLRDAVERQWLGVRSLTLAEELRGLRQNRTSIEAHGRAHDDAAIAAALAVQGYLQYLVPELGLEEPGTPGAAVREEQVPTVLSETLKGFLATLGRRRGETAA